uniref:Alpha-L-arabinofuranosidase B arabinose-binding domain-containing protein n=1 Tax=Populus davidiana TaxID=266767 RepID=A0A6M2FB52_9ROSI
MQMEKEMKGLLALAMVSMLCSFGISKECTNIPTQLSSHSFRYELLSSKNETWKEEMFEHYHLIPTDDSAWASLLPRKILREEDEHSWEMMYRNLKSPLKSSGNFLNEMSLHNVRLDPSSIHWKAQQTNLEYLLMLDVNNLVWSFRKTAGSSTPGKAYGGWEAPDSELRGHFVGHYLSASAQMWASTHNVTLKKKMSAVVSALSACQVKMGTGYLSAFPSELFDRFEAIKPVWAPYYTIHKILAGLLDQYTLADNAQALKMVKWMVDYFYNRVRNVITNHSVERHYLSLNEETGGMNDVLYKLFSITGDPKHLVLAHLFDKPCFLGLLAVQADDISGFHANTHIPVVIGAQMRYEITGDPLYKDIGAFFMDVVNSSHSYATGGTSVSEFWSDPKRLASTLQTENEESCTTYNMLKVSRHLFRWTKEMAYADYYERALTNGVLGIQRGTEPGVMIYMLPQHPGSSKGKSFHGWGSLYDTFWCCYGTGIESFSKLGDSIYFEEEGEAPGLYIIQYISSSLDWKSGQIMINQKVDPVVSSDPYLRVTFTFSPNEGSSQASTLNLRIPVWTHLDGATATINSQSLAIPAPGSFLSVNRKWSSGDKLSLQLPISLRTEAIQDDRHQYASIQAILYGPYLLAGHTSGDWNLKAGSADSLSDSITPIPASYNEQLVSFSQDSGNSTFVLTNSNQSISMEKLPESGTDASLQATFRLVLKDSSSSKLLSVKDVIGKSVMLEPFHLPGMLLVQQGKDRSFALINSADDDGSSIFRVVSGLDGKDGTVSLESGIQNGCYVYSGVDYKSGQSMKLSCKSETSSDTGFNQGASFVMNKGLSQYHPISFVAKGDKRNFLLAPLHSLRDESYTIYFNIQP